MIVILNAPPSSGKDTIARLLSSHGYAVTEFKETMFKIATTLSGLELHEYMARYDNRNLKELPWDKLGGLSCREFMIHISEDIMKPLYGDDVFGKRASERCEQLLGEGYDNVVFSDGGFIDEVNKLIYDGFEVAVVRLHRDGYTFEGDSRDYLYPNNCKCLDINLVDGHPFLAVEEILREIGK